VSLALTSRRVRLLSAEHLFRTGPVDHANWNYRLAIGWLQRQRFALAKSLLPAQCVDNILEIGYGSGIFMPELATHCTTLRGIDVHPYHQDVANRLGLCGTVAELRSGSAEDLPYADGLFDCIVAVSSLEFINDIDAAAREIRRTLRVGGSLVFVTPVAAPWLDLGLRILTGASAGQDFENRRERLLPALARHFNVCVKRTYPTVVSRVCPVYKAYRMR
jgi:ubiquinone/menaquinone biosynthesis C-methylase UbiE